MFKFLAIALFSFSSLLISGATQARHVEPSLILASSPQVIRYGSTSFYYYHNNLIVPINGIYSTRALRNMAGLTRHLGIRHAYILSPRHQYGMPLSYQHRANREFRRYGVSYDYYNPQQHYYQPRHHSYRDRHYNSRKYDRYNRRHHSNQNRSGFFFNFRF